MNKKEPKLDAFKNWNKDLELKPKQEKDKLIINETDNLENLSLNSSYFKQINMLKTRILEPVKKIYTTFYLSKHDVEKLKKIAKLKNTNISSKTETFL